jgi:uncharacterized protein (TIGR02145 family)
MKTGKLWSVSRYLTVMVLTLSLIGKTVIAQSTVTDYDGNIYNTVTIGSQVWLNENLKSLHYSDSTLIPGVVSYNNSDSLGNIYGSLYTWNAAMKNTTTAGAQGVCPCEWHVPTDQEWTTLETYLGGASIAGNKMKDTTSGQWDSIAFYPGASNSSGLKVLPGGEYDDYYTPHIFQLLHQYAVFWTSTQFNSTKARERFIAYNSSASGIYNWYKVMKYSIRCIRNTPAIDIHNDHDNMKSFQLNQNYPNPFNPSTNISFELPKKEQVKLTIYNIVGQEVKELINRELPAGEHHIEWNAEGMASGIYIYNLETGGFKMTKKMILIR